MARAIGIDLGTYNSAAAVALGRNRVAMVESKYGRTLYGKSFPSFVLFDKEGRKQKVGQRAREELSLNPSLVVWGVKRLVGLSYRQALESRELERFQYAIEEGPSGSILIRVGDERYSPSHILELILREIKADAENPRVNPLLEGPIDKAIISIPAYYKAIRTAPIVDAARRAGFNQVDTIAEPTAAAMHYCLEIEKEANLLAFDIGAGTLDVTVMLVVNEDGELVPGELCTSGHESLGGIDMDDLLIDYVVDRFDLGGLRGEPALMAILKQEVEKTKIRLSTRQTAVLDLPGKESAELSRAEIEEVLHPLLEKCRGPVRVALRQAGIEASELEHVLFIGGPTHMPAVRRLVIDELRRAGAKPELLVRLEQLEDDGLPVDPMECVARGAALKAGEIIEPVGKVIAEGYGTLYGSGTGEKDYYCPIIPENANYPISGSAVICHRDPGDLEVPVPLVAKRPDVERSTEKEIVFRYEYIGDYTLGITPTGGIPSIEIQLQVTDDKRIVANLVQAQTRQRVRFEGLDSLSGSEIELQEDKPPESLAEDEAIALTRTVDSRKGRWTKVHLEHHLHVAREAIAIAGETDHPRIASALAAVEQAIEAAIADDLGQPNSHCPTISNRIKELLDAMRQPGVELLTRDEFRNYTAQLSHIAKQV